MGWSFLMQEKTCWIVTLTIQVWSPPIAGDWDCKTLEQSTEQYKKKKKKKSHTQWLQFQESLGHLPHPSVAVWNLYDYCSPLPRFAQWGKTQKATRRIRKKEKSPWNPRGWIQTKKEQNRKQRTKTLNKNTPSKWTLALRHCCSWSSGTKFSQKDLFQRFFKKKCDKPNCKGQKQKDPESPRMDLMKKGDFMKPREKLKRRTRNAAASSSIHGVEKDFNLAHIPSQAMQQLHHQTQTLLPKSQKNTNTMRKETPTDFSQKPLKSGPNSMKSKPPTRCFQQPELIWCRIWQPDNQRLQSRARKQAWWWWSRRPVPHLALTTHSLSLSLAAQP